MLRRQAGLIEAEVDGELVALHVENGTCYGFNQTATRVWALLEEPMRLSQLRDRLVEEYEVAPEECEAQLRDLLAELTADGLIAVEP
jgi:hypothetical protein